MSEEIKQEKWWLKDFHEIGKKVEAANGTTYMYNQMVIDFIEKVEKEALQKRDSQIIKMLENTDVQMSVNGDVSQDEIAMAKFIYKAHIRHIIKKIESAIIPPNSINGILPSETDSATK